ncbi:hypothetical protein LAZ40_01155 [Cereibacter sphaeroides]|uniref:hypothetical protein n=1 Tax=Cereibacter sphaeroides TaxID=1063 RepID=UPI001F3743C5|nr:hypothetical protein [Cereibacter sphaeroides]MCE6957674.1 hypothetical protein [Cereibacter sphaeroides]MCE6971406.1 hypothetical protein [Cereibacter sphaeroides]
MDFNVRETMGLAVLALVGLVIFGLVVAAGVGMILVLKYRIRTLSNAPDFDLRSEVAMFAGLCALVFASSLTLAFAVRPDMGARDVSEIAASGLDFFAVAAIGLVATAVYGRMFERAWVRHLATGATMVLLFLTFPLLGIITLVLTDPGAALGLLLDRLGDVLAFPLVLLEGVARVLGEPRFLYDMGYDMVMDAGGNHFLMAEVYARWLFAYVIVAGSYDLVVNLARPQAT